MPTRVTQARDGNVSSHEISWSGASGAIFWLVMLSGLVLVVSFTTTAWYIKDGYHEGLWETCSCSSDKNDSDKMKVTQAMITLGLICLIVSFLFTLGYMVIHRFSKSKMLRVLTVGCFAAGIFLLIGVIIYGESKKKNLHFSFALACISCIGSFIAGCLAVYVGRKSGSC